MAGAHQAKDEFNESATIDVNIVGGTITGVDGAVLDGVNSAIKATVLDYAASNPIAVRLTDTGGDYVAAGAGTQYTEDAAAAANPVGGALMLIREDARAGGLTTTDGDNVALRGNNKGEAYVKDTDASALLTTIDADTSTLAGAVAGSEVQVDVLTMPTVAVTGTFWQATQPVSGTFWQATQPVSIASAIDTELTTADLDLGAGTDTRAVVGLVGAKDGGGVLIPGDATAGLKVDLGADNDVTLAVLPDTATSDLANIYAALAGTLTIQYLQAADWGIYAEDDIHGNSEFGQFILAVRNDTPGSLVDTDGDYAPIQVDSGGNVRVVGTVSATDLDIRNLVAATDIVDLGGNALTSLQLLDNAISGAGFNITQLGGAAVPIGAGTEATAIRVTLPTDGTGKVTSLPGITGIGHGIKVVTTAGTDETLAGSTACKRVTIQAKTDNSGLIAVGGSGVDATEATGTGVLLYPGDVFELEIDNLADVYVDSTVDANGVRYTYFT